MSLALYVSSFLTPRLAGGETAGTAVSIPLEPAVPAGFSLSVPSDALASSALLDSDY